VDSLTATRVVVAGKRCPVDALITSTSFRASGIGGPGAVADTTVAPEVGKIWTCNGTKARRRCNMHDAGMSIQGKGLESYIKAIEA